MTSSDVDDAGLVGPSDIADMAGVSRSAVSNWRKRRDDFPRSVTGTSAKPLFDRAEVVQWLTSNGHSVQQDAGEIAVWALLNSFRGELPVETMTDLVQAFLCVRKLAADSSDREALRNAAVNGQVLDGANAISRDLRWNDLMWETVEAATEQLSGARQEALYRFLNALFLSIDGLALQDLATVGDYALSRSYSFEGRGGGSEGVVGSTLSRLLANAASPATGTVYDPACGIGEALLQIWKESSNSDLRLVGHDINRRAVRIARQRFFLYGVDAQLTCTDVLTADPAPELRADVIVAEPPLGMAVPPNFSVTDVRWALGGPATRSNSDTAWLQHAVSHLAPTGRGYVLTTMGTSFGVAGAKARRALLRAGCIETVILLPSKLLPYTAITTVLWVLRAADSSPRDSVLMVDASNADPGAELAQWISAPSTSDVPTESQRVTSARVQLEHLIADDDANMNPQRWVDSCSDEVEIAERHHRARTELTAHLTSLRDFRLEPVERQAPSSHVATVRELETRGALRVTRGRATDKSDDDETQADPRIVTTGMVRDGLPALPLHAPPDAGSDATSPGDILATTMRTIRTVVDESGGRTPRQGVIRIWVDPTQFSPHYVAACLCAGWNQRFQHGMPIPHAAIKDLEIPLIPLQAQREIADRVQRLQQLQEHARHVSAASDELAGSVLDAVRFNVAFDSPA